MKFLDWLKKNWVNIVAAIIALLGCADVAAGLGAGKSLTNVAVIPSLVGAAGAVGTLLFRLLVRRGRASVSYPAAPDGLDSEAMRLLGSLYELAGHIDVTPEMVINLSNMAAATVIGHSKRVQEARRSVPVVPETNRIDVSMLREALGIIPESVVSK